MRSQKAKIESKSKSTSNPNRIKIESKSKSNPNQIESKSKSNQNQNHDRSLIGHPRKSQESHKRRGESQEILKSKKIYDRTSFVVPGQRSAPLRSRPSWLAPLRSPREGSRADKGTAHNGSPPWSYGPRGRKELRRKFQDYQGFLDFQDFIGFPLDLDLILIRILIWIWIGLDLDFGFGLDLDLA